MENRLQPIERLKNMGFRRIGLWQMHADRLRFTLDDHSTLRNVLYAFISNGVVLYIGKTVQTLSQRMCGYQRPGPTQSTNRKCEQLIRKELSSGSVVEIYALPDNGLLYYGGFHINLAAGLEDNLVSEFRPAWNRNGIRNLL